MSDDDVYEIPLQDQRVFGAGIKRKRVKFVPSTTPTTSVPTGPSISSIGDAYLKMVLKEARDTEGEAPSIPSPSGAA